MKKNYTSPAIEIEKIEVEQGIAISVVSDGFTVGGYDEQEDLSDMWQ